MAGIIRWTPKQWNQFLKSKGMVKDLSNKQLARKVVILEKKVSNLSSWLVSIVAKLKKGEF